ncbi:unnamed protein product [Rhizophagus irregularis]|nr:unnamed protein product [Rhizophagus irregularis]
MILRYIYTGELNLTKQSCEDILGLLIASDELLIEELCNYIQDYLIVKPNKWIKNNFTLIFRTAFKLTGCKKLQDYCFESICKNFDSFITTNDFLSLDKDILYELLKRDDLQIEEVVAWDYLIKWGIEQTPGKQYLYAHNESHNYEDNLNTNEIYVIEEIETFNVTKE